jgi:hypothetical protein
VIPHEPADEEFVSSLLARLIDGLVEEERIADRGVDYAIEDMREGFALLGEKGVGYLGGTFLMCGNGGRGGLCFLQ